MPILLVDIDSTIPNLALKKIEKYYKDKGEFVIWNMPPHFARKAKTYVSCVFSWNKEKVGEWLDYGAEVGGSGYSLEITLPPEIEEVKPHINLGFTTRGCIRRCGFCVVPKKEGKIRAVGDIYDLWDGEGEEIILIDNNILALPEHFKLVCHQLRENKLIVDFNQGLDCRLLTEDIMAELVTIRHKELRFAFDHPKEEPYVRRAVEIIQKFGVKRANWYVLVGYDTTMEEDLQRLYILKSYDQDAFLQRYNFSTDRLYIPMAQWVNHHASFRKLTYDQYLRHPRNREWLKVYEKHPIWEKIKRGGIAT